MAQVIDVHRTRQIRRIAIPVEQVKRRRFFPFQIVADDVIPDQVVRTQKRKGGGEIAPSHQPALPDLLFSQRYHRLVDKDAKRPGISKIEKGTHECHCGNGTLIAGCKYRKTARQQGSANAKTQGVDLINAGDFAGHPDRLQNALREIVIPGELCLVLPRVTPGNHEHRMSARNGKGHQRIVRLQIENVVFVDTGWDHQQGTAPHLRGSGFVLNQLKQRVFEDDRPLAGRHVATDLKGLLIGHRNATLLKIAQEIVDAMAQALTFAFHQTPLGLRVGRQKIRWCQRITPLANREANPVHRLWISLKQLGGAAQELGIHQV